MFNLFSKPAVTYVTPKIELDDIVSMFTDAIEQLEMYNDQENIEVADLQNKLAVATANVAKATRIADKLKNLVD